jgi:glucosamine-phosphate N-acetyltransferase
MEGEGKLSFQWPAEGTMEITIRELRGFDNFEEFLDSLANLADVELTPEKAKEVFRNQLRLGVRTYVACVQGRIVGTASLLIEPKFIHGGGLSGHLEDVAVHRDFQKQGIGAALVRHVTAQAREMGCYKVVLNCFDNMAPFYEKLGFRRHDAGLRMDL